MKKLQRYVVKVFLSPIVEPIAVSMSHSSATSVCRLTRGAVSCVSKAQWTAAADGPENIFHDVQPCHLAFDLPVILFSALACRLDGQ